VVEGRHARLVRARPLPSGTTQLLAIVERPGPYATTHCHRSRCTLDPSIRLAAGAGAPERAKEKWQRSQQTLKRFTIAGLQMSSSNLTKDAAAAAAAGSDGGGDRGGDSGGDSGGDERLDPEAEERLDAEERARDAAAAASGGAADDDGGGGDADGGALPPIVAAPSESALAARAGWLRAGKVRCVCVCAPRGRRPCAHCAT